MKKYIVALCLVSTAACTSYYPELEVDLPPTKNPDPEVITDRVPVMLSMTDPDYSIVTRGVGALDSWTERENRAAWLQADFGVYAFLAKNHDYKGAVNYSVQTDQFPAGQTPYCLIYDRKVKIQSETELSLGWVDENYTPYYSMEFPEYKYNFFAYYLDDARCSSEQHLSDRIVKNIEIDGTQDIISSFAQPTTKQIEQIQTDDEFKYIATNWENLIYSTRSGNRGISPVFYLSHQMARMKFKLVGVTSASDQVLVRSIAVVTPRKGAFTVAADPGESKTPDLDIQWDENSRDTVYVRTDSTSHEFGATLNQQNCIFEPALLVTSGESLDVSNAILLPDIKSFSVVIGYQLADRLEDGIFYARYSNVALEDKTFESGHSYDVQLKIYGPQSVDLQIGTQSMGWIDGGTLPPIDED